MQKTNVKKHAAVLAILLAAVFVCMLLANGIQTNHGQVDLSTGYIQTDLGGSLCYKLYTPKTATPENPAPGVLLLHGYQNDHETCAAYAIELARRGVVVMALDEYGHGSTQPGMIHRGYVNHKVTVNYGEDSAEEGTFVEIGGANRYRVMMNFSNLSFFDAHYTTDEDGNTLRDSSMGGVAAYAVLASLPNVDSSRLALSGHSMGTWASWSVAAAYAGQDIAPKATVLQCGELFRNSAYDAENIKFNNVLLLQAKYDEFSYFRDYKNIVSDELLSTPLRCEFLGCEPGEGQWNHTYGSFAEGTARRIELLMTNHRLATHDKHGLTAAMAWFGEALSLDTTLPANDLTAMGKEFLVLLAMLCAVASMLPLMQLLLALPFFAKAAQPLPDKQYVKSPGKWWRGAVITILLAGMSYPFMTQLGHGLLPLPEKVFRMTIGNGFLSWYTLLILIMLVTSLIGCKKAARNGGDASMYGMGLGTAEAPGKLGWGLLGRNALLVVCMIGLLYILTVLCETFFLLDLRFIWPFFRGFSSARFGQFLIYLPIFALFFILNNSKIMASMRTAATYQPGVKGFLACWWRNALLMVGGVLIIVLIEYIPFFLNIAPGADLLFGSTFGGPFMSLLILFVPQVIAFSLICTYTYRRTGSVYAGALTVASMACWIVTGGSAML